MLDLRFFHFLDSLFSLNLKCTALLTCAVLSLLFRLHNVPDWYLYKALFLFVVTAAPLPHTPQNLEARHPAPLTRRRMKMTTKMMTMTTRMSPLLRNDLRNQHANDLCFSETGSPSCRLTFCQMECGTGNKLPLAHDVKFQTLRLFIPLYIDLYFYQFVYPVHTGFVSWGGLISCVLVVLLLLKDSSKSQVRHKERASASRNFPSTPLSVGSHIASKTFFSLW